MSVPSRREAADILHALEAPDWLVRHSVAVAEIGAFLAQRLAARGTTVDAALIEAAGLLHDVDKALPENDALQALGHPAAGAAWLRRRGHGELAAAVAHHSATLLSDDERYPSWVATASLEERVVAYADKRAEADVVTLEQRFASWRRRHPEFAAELALGQERARTLEREVCSAAGVEPPDVARLPVFDGIVATTAR